MFKGYISNAIGGFRWIIHTRTSFLIPYLEGIAETTNQGPLTILRKDRFKIMGEFTVTHEGKAQTYLVKIYHYPSLTQRIKQFFKQTRAFHEFNTTYRAAMKGAPVETPVAYGEQRGLLPGKSCLVIRKIERSRTLREYFKDNPSGKDRSHVLREFGKLAKTIHDAGIRQDDFSLDNFLVCDDEAVGKKLFLIDFERVSIQKKGLQDAQRAWYLAKLNRARRYFTNADRLRFLSAYAGSDTEYGKKLARRIEPLTIHIQKKDAKKFRRQCVHENRKFGVWKNGHWRACHRKNYDPKVFVPLLDAPGNAGQDVLYQEGFRIERVRGRKMRRAWTHANALFAFNINVGIPVVFLERHAPPEKRASWLISRIPDNCVPLRRYAETHPDKNLISGALVRLAEQVSPYGVFRADLNSDGLLARMGGKHPVCYLANYHAFCINHDDFRKNREINLPIIRQVIERL